MRKIILVNTFMFLLSFYGFSQNNWAIALGNCQTKDYLLTQRRFVGFGIGFNYGRSFNSDKFEKEFNYKFNLGLQKDRLGFFGIPIYSNYSYSQKYILNKSISVGIKAFKNFKNHFFFGLDDGHLYWLSGIGVSPSVKYNLPFNENKISFEVSAYILGFNSRPDYPDFKSNFKTIHFFTNQFKDLKFTTFLNSYSYEFVINYLNKKNKKKFFGISYEQYNDIKILTYEIGFYF